MSDDDEDRPINPRKLHWACLFAVQTVVELVCALPFILLGWVGSWMLGHIKVGHTYHQAQIDRSLERIKWFKE